MTLQDLRQYPSTKAEINRLSRRLNELRLELAAAENEKLKAEIKELYAELEKLHIQQIAKELEITKFIQRLNDTQLRVSIQLHFIDGYTWNEVAAKIGGGNTEDSCRQYVRRKLKLVR